MKRILEIMYPNKKFGGIYCLGPLVIENIVNKLPNWHCERKYLDEKLTSKLIGFSFQYELDYKNFFKILDENKISLDKKYRKEVLFAGGPCVNANPETLSEYMDFFVLGDAEETIKNVLKNYDEDKIKFLKKIKNIEGVYIPKGKKQYVYSELKLENYPFYQPFPKKIDKNYVFGKCFILETERGCPFSCKFCILPKLKVRYRSLEDIKKIVDLGLNINKAERVVIYSPSFTHPKRKEFLSYLIKKGVRFSVPSIKVGAIDKETLELIRKGGQKSITIAPESDQETRYRMGKKISDKTFFEFIETAKEVGFTHLKVYILIGVPEQEEIGKTIGIMNEIKKRFNNVSFSINVFIPKPKSEYEKYQLDKRKIEKEIKFIHKNFKGKYKIRNFNLAYKEWKLAHANSLSSLRISSKQ